MLDAKISAHAFVSDYRRAVWLAAIVAMLRAAVAPALAQSVPAKSSLRDERLPHRVYVFEDYETEIEKRWWLRGAPETNNVAPILSQSVPNRRACRATATKDFDDKMGDPAKNYKAVVFNPVPGPPMGANTRLSFRYWLQGTDALRVQIYSLSKGYHRFFTLTNLAQDSWQSATVDMTQARRPDGSGGPLTEDERIDDIQFYVAPEAELILDDIVLYDAAPVAAGVSPAVEPGILPGGTGRNSRGAGISRIKPGGGTPAATFPKRIIFTGWFDTGKQGAEWPGDFEIVKHERPLAWNAAKSVVNTQTSQPWIRVHLRGLRPLSQVNRLRFRHRLTREDQLRLVLASGKSGAEWGVTLKDLSAGKWAEAAVDFNVGINGAFADEIRFFAVKGAEFLVDELLLYEPDSIEARRDSSSWVKPMKKVHARFTGAKGTFAQFGDSITVTMAFWAPLAGNPKNMNAEMARALQLVKGYQKPECWSRWKGPEFGNNGSMTIRWAHENVEKWLKKLNPEVVLIMFGSNDVGQMDATEYETKTREVVARCLNKGTVVILSTMPPRTGLVEKSRRFADAVRKIAKEQNVPLVDYFGEILKRRPEDWDGALPKFKGLPGDEYQVPTLISRDGVHPSNPKLFAGDYSEEALGSSGYGLRNFLTVMAYAELIERILAPTISGTTGPETEKRFPPLKVPPSSIAGAKKVLPSTSTANPSRSR